MLYTRRKYTEKKHVAPLMPVVARCKRSAASSLLGLWVRCLSVVGVVCCQVEVLASG